MIQYIVVPLDDKIISRSNSLTYLGVTIDCELSWNEHIDVISTNFLGIILYSKKIYHNSLLYNLQDH